jgi:hypothetical protein
MTRKMILTKAVLASIPELAASGLNRREIAEHLGCKLSTLKVRCCQERIPLPNDRRRGTGPRSPKTKRIKVSQDTVALFHAEAEAKGTTVTEIVARLLELIVKDKLINAILDEEVA